jgi:hypothetical protein
MFQALKSPNDIEKLEEKYPCCENIYEDLENGIEFWNCLKQAFNSEKFLHYSTKNENLQSFVKLFESSDLIIEQTCKKIKEIAIEKKKK